MTDEPKIIVPPLPTEQETKLKLLLEPFAENELGKLPKGVAKDGQPTNCEVCGGYHKRASVHIDYVGHATLTRRLLEVDPHWNWEPYSVDANGSPIIDKSHSNEWALWIKLTIVGVTRIGVGTVEANKHDAFKELIGDALRNAGMRFGLALNLWEKERPTQEATTRKRTTKPKEPEEKQAEHFVSKGITQPQTKLVGVLMGKIDITDRESRIAYARNVIGRDDIESIKDLNKKEAHDLIDTLQKDQPEVVAEQLGVDPETGEVLAS